MKKIFAIGMLAAALMACTNVEMEQNGENDAATAYTLTIQATKGDGNATKALSLDESGAKNVLNATWNEGEKVLVYQTGVKKGELTAAASTTSSTTLSGTLGGDLNTSQGLTFYFHTPDNPSYTGQDGTLATIGASYDFCAPAIVKSGNYTVDNVNKTVYVPGGIHFGENNQAIVRFTLRNRADTKPTLNASHLNLSVSYNNVELKSVSMDIPDATYTTNGSGIIYFAIPADIPDTYKSHINDFTFVLTATVGSETYKLTTTGFPFENGKYYEVSVYMKNDKLGKVLGQNGQIYDNVSAAEAAGTTAVAMIAYLGENTGESNYKHGLAIALTDCKEGKSSGTYNYKNYNTTANHEYKTTTIPFSVEGGIQHSSEAIDDYPAFKAAFGYKERYLNFSKWFLGTGYQWQQMIESMGSNIGLRESFQRIGGENMKDAGYWLSTEYNNEQAWYLPYSSIDNFSHQNKMSLGYVRPSLAF